MGEDPLVEEKLPITILEGLSGKWKAILAQLLRHLLDVRDEAVAPHNSIEGHEYSYQ